MKTILQKALSILRAFLFLLPALTALLLYGILPHFPEFTEYVFSRGIFRLISVPLGMLSSLFPFSLTEVAAVAALPVLIWLIVRLVRKMKTAPSRARLAAKVGQAAGWVLSTAFLLYMVLHGLNFYRLPVSDLMGLDTSPKSAEYLQAVCIDLATKASAAREKVPKDGEGNVLSNGSNTDVLWNAGKGYEALENKYPFLWGAVKRGKPVHLSHWWSYTGITGMYFPFFAEANVNVDQPVFDIPATAAHELAHTRGFAREDECNFFACLACFHHPCADYQYSGYLMAYVYCANALYAYDQDLWLATREYCSDGMKADLKQRNDYWEQFEGQVQEISDSINNSFIEIQGDNDGVLSYDRVVELLLAYYEKEGLV